MFRFDKALAVTALMVAMLLPALAYIPYAYTADELTARPSQQLPTCPSISDPQHPSRRSTWHDSPICVFLHPGKSDQYKLGWSHTLDTLWGTQAGATFPALGEATTPGPGTPESNAQTHQVFDDYLDYAILVSGSKSIGDLQFDIQVLTAINYIDILVPPEFEWLASTKEESVWTDITNDYQYISVSTRSIYDLIAPRWVRIRIGHGFIESLTIPSGIYHVRLFNLGAPEMAGLYHIKIWVNEPLLPPTLRYHSIGAGNYPFIVVKAELDPAWIEVVVRTQSYRGPPSGPLVSGRVQAQGVTSTGRSVVAVGYWGPMEFIGNTHVPPRVSGGLYRIYVFGIAAGTYTITAEASGFNPTTTEPLALHTGQSYHTLVILSNSPTVSVTVWSKHGTGQIPWHNLWQLPFGTNNPAAMPENDVIACPVRPAQESAGVLPCFPRRDILIDLYDSYGNLIGFWASDFLGQWGLGFPNPFLMPGLATKGIPPPNWLAGLHDDVSGGIGGTIPTRASYHALLVDNFDALWTIGAENRRQYPSTQWDGHVPWDVADYVAGMPNGQYTIEAFVTGYVMDEADAHQRTFSLAGSRYELQFDLRRSNWIETVMHLPSNVLAGPYTTVTLTAIDVAAEERASVAFYATPAMAADSVLDGCDVSGLLPVCYRGGIVIEGWNNLFPNRGNEQDARDYGLKDYGLTPAASSHTADRVILGGNPYTIRLSMADMGIPYGIDADGNGVADTRIPGTGWYNIIGGDPQVSVFLCNSPVPLSFGIVNAWLWISLRSVDFEVPAHSRPWIFPGSEIWMEFTDAVSGEVIDVLDPTVYGLLQDPGIAIPGFPITGAPPGSFGLTPFDIDNIQVPGQHDHLAVEYYGTDWCSPNSGLGGANALWYALLPSHRSTRLPAGEYIYNVYTHGYVMRRSFPVQVPFAGWADIEADLIQGGQIRVTMEFRHEGRATAFNGFIRVEVFNAANELVGASIYGQAEPNAWTRIGPLGGSYFNFAPWADWLWGNWGIFNTPFENTYVTGPAEGAGLGFLNGFGWLPSFSRPQRAWTANWLYGLPTETWRGWSGLGTRFFNPWYFVVNPFTGGPWGTVQNYSPPDSNRVVMPAGAIQSFDVFGFHWYYGDGARTWAGGWPTTNGWNSATFPNPNTGSQYDYGLRGSIDIPGWEGSGGGLYSVKVWAFDARGPNGVYDAGIPVDDWRMYAMGWDLANVEVPWGGSVELFITMNNLASLRGTVRWFDMYGNLRPLPWAQVSASPGPATDQVPAYSSGLGAVGPGASDPSGSWIMWVPAGTHDVSVTTSEASQVWSSSAPTSNAEFTVVVSNGWVGGGDSQLGQSGTPVPELPSIALPIGLFAVLAASVWLLRRRTLSIPVLIK